MQNPPNERLTQPVQANNCSRTLPRWRFRATGFAVMTAPKKQYRELTGF